MNGFRWMTLYRGRMASQREIEENDLYSQTQPSVPKGGSRISK